MVSYVPPHGPDWWVKAAVAGLLAGVVMAVLEILVMGAGQGRGYWTFLYLIGATIVPLRGTYWAAALVGGVVHLIVSALWGLAFGYVALYGASRTRASTTGAIVGGLLWGTFVWGVMGLFIGPFLDPPIGALFDDLLWFGTHLVYGVLVAVPLLVVATRPGLRVTWAPAERVIAGRGIRRP